jgi:hypothetical protein
MARATIAQQLWHLIVSADLRRSRKMVSSLFRRGLQDAIGSRIWERGAILEARHGPPSVRAGAHRSVFLPAPMMPRETRYPRIVSVMLNPNRSALGNVALYGAMNAALQIIDLGLAVE